MWPRIYLYGLFQALIFDEFLWFIYLEHLGYSAVAISLGYSIFQFTQIVLDIPSSWAANHLGKRAVLFMAAGAKILSSIYFLFGGLGYGWIIAGFIAGGISSGLPSGVDLAYVSDVAKIHFADDETAKTVRRKFSGFITMQTVAALVAGLTGGLLAAVSFRTLYTADTMVGMITLGLVWLLPASEHQGTQGTAREITRGTVSFHVSLLWEPFVKATVLLWRSSSRFRSIGAVSVIVWTLSSILTEYSQGLLQNEGWQPTSISFLLSMATLLSICASWLSGRWNTERTEHCGILLSLWLYAGSGILRAIGLPSLFATQLLSVGGVAFQRFGSGLSLVLLNGQMLRTAPATSRAIALSAVNTLEVLLITALGPLFGFIATQWSFYLVYGICGAALGILALSKTVASAMVR